MQNPIQTGTAVFLPCSFHSAFWEVLVSVCSPCLVYPEILLKPGLKKPELFSIRQSLPFTPKYLLCTLPLTEQVRACLLFFLFLASLVLCGPWRATRPEEHAALISVCRSCVQHLLGQAGPFISERGPANPKEQEETFLLLVYFWQNRNSSAADAVLPGWGWEQEVEPVLLTAVLLCARPTCPSSTSSHLPDSSAK